MCQIKAGSSEFGPFCGDKPPGDIQTDSNTVTVSFHSDNSGENLGWRMTYSSTGIHTHTHTHNILETNEFTTSVFFLLF